MYGYLHDVAIECHSPSGRTHLTFNNPDLGHTMTKGHLNIDGKSLYYNVETDNSNNTIVNHLKYGIFTLYYKDTKKEISFHSIPKSVKKIESRIIKANYLFNGIIMLNSTDPRESQNNNDKTLDYDIQVECSLEILSNQN